ncbi:MAG: MarR family transcriptional regulator [Firmicutes bacterium]|nr:MarR family transcriptional regulator [Bacillota bacterium]
MQGFFRRCLLLNRAFISKMNEVLGVYGLSYSKWTVVCYVKDHGSSMLVDIANHANVRNPVITRIVQRLEENGVVQQIPGLDKREKIIELTEKGERIYQECRKVIDNLERKVLAGISEEEIKAAFEVFPKVRDNLMDIGDNKNE